MRLDEVWRQRTRCVRLSFARTLGICLASAVLCWMGMGFDAAVAAPPVSAANQPAGPEKSSTVVTEASRQLFTGKVVLLMDALKRRKITVRDEMKGQVVLEAENGDLWPILADWRGRAFFQDERLRNRKVELVCRRPPGTPYLQILMVFTFDDKGERQYTDYWCDICSIPMYEIKDCDCCQGPVRLRFERQPLPDYLSPRPVK